MEEIQEPGSKGTWRRTLAIFFLFVFAMFWSLGPFFFWISLALAAYFGILHLISSGSISDFFSSFKREPKPADPSQTFRPQQPGQVPADVRIKVMKVVRGMIIFFVALFTFFFVVGVLVGNDDDEQTTVAVEGSEAAPEDANTTMWNEKGNAALSESKYDSAMYYYDQAIALDPENMFALYNKGLTFTLKADYRRGNAYARKCVHYHPDYNPAWWLLGYNYDLLSKTDSAVYCLEKAYLNDYSQPDFLQLMADVYVKKDRRADALNVYKKIVSMDSTKVDAYRKMAELDPANAERYRSKANALEQK